MMSYRMPPGMTLGQELQLRQYYDALPDDPQKLKHQLLLVYANILQEQARLVELPKLPSAPNLEARLSWLQSVVNVNYQSLIFSNHCLENAYSGLPAENLGRWKQMRNASQTAIEQAVATATCLLREHGKELEVVRGDRKLTLIAKEKIS